MTPDSIEVRSLDVLAFCGVLPEEKARRQPFRIDIDLWLDLSAAGGSDDLAKTVNYGDLIDKLVVLADEIRVSLLEVFAQAIADVALSYELVDAVTVRVRKLRPPVEADVETTGVRIHRKR